MVEITVLFRNNKISHLDHLNRFREVCNILIRNGFGFIFDRIDLRRILGRRVQDQSEAITGASAPVRLRHAIQELGPTFIKLGQLLSTRPDLIPPEYITELEKLQDDIPAIPFAAVEQVCSDAGIDLQKDFTWVDPDPIAAASIGQVHKARLTGGEEVVLKVQRPGVDKIVETDLEILAELGSILQKRTSWGRVYKISEVIDELASAITNELDFEKEARNADIFYKNFEHDDKVIIPRVYWQYTSKKVLTLEYVDGIKISDFSGLKNAGYDTARICKNLVEAFFKQLYDHGFFHADPHPGNIAVTDHEGIILYDFGQVGVIDEVLKQNCVELLLGMMRYDAEKVTQALIKLRIGDHSVDKADLKQNISRLQQKYYGLPLSQIKIGEALSELMELSAKFRIRLPAELSLMIKMFMTVENMISQLDPKLSVIDIAEPYGRKILMKKYSPRQIKSRVKDVALDYANLLEMAPRELQNILDMLKDGEIKIKMEHTNLNRLIVRADIISNRLALAIILASIIIGTSLIVNQTGSRFLNHFPLVQIGFTITMILGLFLIYSIIKSGKY